MANKPPTLTSGFTANLLDVVEAHLAAQEAAVDGPTELLRPWTFST